MTTSFHALLIGAPAEPDATCEHCGAPADKRLCRVCRENECADAQLERMRLEDF